MHLRDVAYSVVHDYPGGALSLAPRMGKNATTLSHEVNGTGTAKLGLVDAEKITHLTKDLRILEAFATHCGQMLVPLPEATVLDRDADCMLRLADTARKFGELCKEVAEDLMDGQISNNEMRRVDRGCGGLISSLYALRQAVARRNLQGNEDQTAWGAMP